MELFGLAWMHYFKAKHEQLEYCLRETSFTKKYLESTGRTEIWDIMQFYNIDCIGESAFEAFTEERTHRAHIVFVNSTKMSLYEDLREKTDYTPKCMGRVLNRYLTDVAWERKVTLSLLVTLCAKRLEWDGNLDSEVSLKLGMIIYGMYDGAMYAIKSVKVSL
jgi:hypothetical protein